MVGRTERSDWSGTDQSGRGVLSGCQKEPSDWLEERRLLIGQVPTVAVCHRILNGHQTEHFRRLGDWSVLIGREATNQDVVFRLCI